MTYTFKKEEKMGLLNLVNLLVMVCIISMWVIGFKNNPDPKAANGILSFYLLVGSTMSFPMFYLSFVRTTTKAKVNWFYVAAAIFMGSFCIGLYQHLTF